MKTFNTLLTDAHNGNFIVDLNDTTEVHVDAFNDVITVTTYLNSQRFDLHKKVESFLCASTLSKRFNPSKKTTEEKFNEIINTLN